MPMNNEGAFEFPDNGPDSEPTSVDDWAFPGIAAYLKKQRAVPLQLAGLSEVARLRAMDALVRS